MARQLLRDTDPMVAAILDGEHDAILDYIEQAAKARRRNMLRATYRVGQSVRLTGTRNAELEGKVGVVQKVNPKRIIVDVPRDEPGMEDFPMELSVPASMLQPA